LNRRHLGRALIRRALARKHEPRDLAEQQWGYARTRRGSSCWTMPPEFPCPFPCRRCRGYRPRHRRLPHGRTEACRAGSPRPAAPSRWN
jgi:hypothetical protein